MPVYKISTCLINGTKFIVLAIHIYRDNLSQLCIYVTPCNIYHVTVLFSHYTSAHSISLPGSMYLHGNTISSTPNVLNVPLLHLLPSSEANNSDAPQPPALGSGDGEEQPPPIPVKASHTMTLLVNGYHSL